MTQKQDTTVKEILQAAINKDNDFLKAIISEVLQELLEFERDQQIGVGKYQRDNKHRKGNRNGYKPRSLNTRLGKLELRKPEIREYSFETRLFEKYQRSEQSLILAMQQMVISGVSTNRIKKITKKLSPNLSFSKSTISRMIKKLDPAIEKWRNERLDEHYEYLISDAIYLHVRENGMVSTRPILITIGIDNSGYRKVLGLDIAYAEDEQSWKNHHQKLKERGVKSIGLTISDSNRGLLNSLEKEFASTPHQRCMVHFERNLLSLVPHKEKKSLSKSIKQIFNAPNREMAIQIAKIIIDYYETLFPSVSRLLTKSLEETLTFFDFPEHHRRKIRTTNLIEHLNSQIKRRTKVINIFPNADSCIRYVSALLQEIDEEWQTGRRYMLVEEKKKKTHLMKEEISNKIQAIKSSKAKQVEATVT